MDAKKRAIIPITVVLVITLVLIGIKIANRENPNEISGSGTIEILEVEISSKIMGKVEKINFDEGDNVREGDLLAVLEHNELNAQENQFSAGFSASKEQVNQIEAQLKNAEDNYNRAKDLFKTGSFSQQQLDAAETQYKVLSSQLKSANQVCIQIQAQYDYVKAQISNAYLKAPISGVILQKNAEIGEIVSPGMSILTVGDLSKPWLKIYIPETKLGKVKLNDKASVKADTFPDKKYEGRVVYISSKAEFTPKNVQTKEERVRLVYAIKIALENTNEELKAGMPADGYIYVKNN